MGNIGSGGYVRGGWHGLYFGKKVGDLMGKTGGKVGKHWETWGKMDDFSMNIGDWMGKQEETWGFNKRNKSEPWGFFCIGVSSFPNGSTFSNSDREWGFEAVDVGSPIFSDKTILFHPFVLQSSLETMGRSPKVWHFRIDRPRVLHEPSKIHDPVSWSISWLMGFPMVYYPLVNWHSYWKWPIYSWLSH